MKNMLNRLSLRGKLILIGVLTSFISLTLLVLIVINNEIDQINKELVSNTKLVASTIADYSVADLSFGDSQAADLSLNKLTSQSDIISITIYDHNNKLFAGSGGIRTDLTNTVDAKYLFTDKYFEISENIYHEGKYMGKVVIQKSTQSQQQDFIELLVYSGLIFWFLVVLSFYIASRLQNIISKPILKLSQFTRQIENQHDYSLRIQKLAQDEIGQLYDSFNEMLKSIELGQKQRDEAMTALQHAGDELEQRIQERTLELQNAVEELQAFSYSVSHDLRAPLRSIDGFSKILMEDYMHELGNDAREYLTRVRKATLRMDSIINDLLNLSRISNSELNIKSIDLSAMCHEVFATLKQSSSQTRDIDIHIQGDMQIQGDEKLMLLAFENLLGNAWKYTLNQPHPRIDISLEQNANINTISITDNGAGFNMDYANKLFKPMSRLHSDNEFEGTGIGLAIVYRIIKRHAASIEGTGKPNQGATFRIKLSRLPL